MYALHVWIIIDALVCMQHYHVAAGQGGSMLSCEGAIYNLF